MREVIHYGTIIGLGLLAGFGVVEVIIAFWAAMFAPAEFDWEEEE